MQAEFPRRAFIAEQERCISTQSPQQRARATACALMLASPWIVSNARAEEATAAAASITKPECAQAFEQSQRLRNAFQFIEAHAEALKCLNPACGSAIAEECGKIYDEVQAETPSIVPVARDENGSDITSVTVRIGQDSKPITLDGTPIPIDPGNHDLVFAAPGFEPAELRVLIRTGERFRLIVGTLHRVAAAPEATKQDASTSAKRSGTGVPLATYILGGVGLAGFAGFAGFRISGTNDFDALSSECKPTCSQASIDAVRRKFVYSDIALAIGAAATVAAVSIYIAAPKAPARAATVQIRQSGDGVTLRLTTAF